MWPSGVTLTMMLTVEFLSSCVTLTFDDTHGLNHGQLYLKMGGPIGIEQRGLE